MKAPWIVAVAFTGCSGGAKPRPAEPEPTRTPAPTPTVAPVEPAGPPNEPPAPVPVEPAAPPPAAAPPEVAAACRGAKLDLKALVGKCDVKARPSMPAEIAIAVEPKPKLASGTQMTASVVLRNTGKAESTIVLDHRCGRITEVTYEMLASNGDRADLDEGGCGTGRGCGYAASAFALPPNGELRLDFTLRARMEKFDADCKSSRVKPVAKGTYDLKVYSGLGDVTTKITID